MSERPRERLEPPALRWGVDTPARAALLGAALVIALETVHLVLTLSLVDAPDAGPLLARGNYRVGIVVSLIVGLTAAALAYAPAGEWRELERHRRALGWSEERFAALVSGLLPRRRPALLAGLLFAPVGLLLVTADDASRSFLLSDDPWTPSIAWAMTQNLLLFGLIGGVLQLTWARRRVDRALDAHPPPLELLDPRLAREIAASGLRRSFFWIVGGSLASLVLVDLDFSWMTALVVVVTLAIGTALFFAPLVKLARRIQRAKDAELARVRERIRSARDALLADPHPTLASSSELPALLAYERRIEEVRPFALGAFQILRFASLVVLALGSWLGGAVMDLLVEWSLR